MPNEALHEDSFKEIADDFFRIGQKNSPITESVRGFKESTDRRRVRIGGGTMAIPKQYWDGDE